MAYVLSSVSGNLISAASAGYAPTNSGDVSAIASAYQVVSATSTQLYAGTAYVTSINEAPVSAARAGNAANASLANSAYYDGTGRLISALPDSATVSAIASSYAESAASSKQDTLTFGYNAANQISSIDGSALGGMDEAAVSGIASAYAKSAISSVSGNYYTTANESGFITAQAQASWSESASASPSYIQDKPDLVDIVAGPGIVVDNPDGNTLRVSMADDYEVTLYSANSLTNNTAGQVFTMAEPVTNFERIRITCDNMEFPNRPCTQEFAVLNSSCRFIMPMINGNDGISINIPHASYTINSSGNLVCHSRGLLYNDWNTPNYTNGDWRGYCLLKVVGIHRIAGGN